MMSKLTLHLEELVVESFPTTEAEKRRGTVHGMETQDSACDSCDCSYMDTCPQPEITCFQSCAGSCASCPVSCNPAQCPSSDGRC
jgi:hypothetical protein